MKMFKKVTVQTLFFNIDALNFQFLTFLLILEIDYSVALTFGDGEMSVVLQKASYPYLNASRLHISDPCCRATRECNPHFSQNIPR